MARIIVFLATILIFTVIGIVVGHLIASGILKTDRLSDHVSGEIALAYISCSVGGLVAGLVVSCFGLWLLSPTAKS